LSVPSRDVFRLLSVADAFLAAHMEEGSMEQRMEFVAHFRFRKYFFPTRWFFF